LYFGLAGSLSAAKSFCLIFGIVYALLGVAGFLLGKPDIPTMPGMGNMGVDPRLFKVIPGILEFGRMDHTVHILLAILFIIGAMTTRKEV
jgi:hypothetical protein